MSLSNFSLRCGFFSGKQNSPPRAGRIGSVTSEWWWVKPPACPSLPRPGGSEGRLISPPGRLSGARMPLAGACIWLRLLFALKEFEGKNRRDYSANDRNLLHDCLV